MPLEKDLTMDPLTSVELHMDVFILKNGEAQMVIRCPKRWTRLLNTYKHLLSFEEMEESE